MLFILKINSFLLFPLRLHIKCLTVKNEYRLQQQITKLDWNCTSQSKTRPAVLHYEVSGLLVHRRVVLPTTFPVQVFDPNEQTNERKEKKRILLSRNEKCHIGVNKASVASQSSTTINVGYQVFRS